MSTYDKFEEDEVPCSLQKTAGGQAKLSEDCHELSTLLLSMPKNLMMKALSQLPEPSIAKLPVKVEAKKEPTDAEAKPEITPRWMSPC